MKLMTRSHKPRSEETRAVSPSTGWSPIERFFERFLGDGWSSHDVDLFDSGAWCPPMDIRESGGKWIVRSEIPGVDPEGLTITVTGDRLTVAGEKSESSEHQDGEFCHTERRFGSFRRSLKLPVAVDPDRVHAEHENGVLTITLEAAEDAAVRRIPVEAKSS